jgi:hypothetical protein
VAYVALFVALSGVTYAAGLKKNSVRSKQIKNGQVRNVDLAQSAVSADKLGDGAVGTSKLGPDAVDASKVGPDALGGADIDEASLAGVDAATLGGTAAGGFALAGHNHDATYVNEGQANSVSSSMVTDISRTVSIPLRSFVECDTNAGADINFSSGADNFPDFNNSSTDGQGFSLRFDDAVGAEDQDVSVCSQVLLPHDILLGSPISLQIFAGKDDSQPPGTEVLHCTFAEGGGAITATGNAEMGIFPAFTYDCPADPTPSYYQGDVMSVSISITSSGTMNDTVDIYGVALGYLAIE